MMICSSKTAVAVAIAGLLTTLYLSANIPKGVHFDTLPVSSPLHFLPPWQIFKPAVAVQDWFARSSLATTPPPIQVLDLATAYWKSEVTYALTKSGIFDAVGKHAPEEGGGGGVTCETVAKDLDLEEHPVCEYMRAGMYLGLLVADDKDRFTLSPSGSMLQSNVPGSLRDFTLMINEETRHAWRAAGTKSIQKGGESGFKEHFGKEFWPWHNKNPIQEAQFDRAMKSLGFSVSGAMLGEWQPKRKDGLVCDIGGGMGSNAKFVLEHYPEMKAFVLDQPEVAVRAKTFFQEEGLDERATAIGGDFFKPLPEELKECDTFFMKFILHDWGDVESVAILENLKAIAKPGSEIVLIEYVLETGAVSGMELTKRMMSINMLASNKRGAKERTLSQYQELFSSAGMDNNNKPAELIPTRSAVSLVKMQL